MLRLALLIGIMWVLLGCGEARVQSQAATPKPDTLLGQWVCVDDYGHGHKGAKVEFREDGTATFTVNGKILVRRYKREPGREWLARRSPRGGKSSDPEWGRVEMVYFADSKGIYLDWGANLLKLDPEIPVLRNSLTQVWARPGDEKRIAQLIK